MVLQDDGANIFDFYADLAEKLDGKQWSPIDIGPDNAKDFSTDMRYEPLGVVAMITPWNYPIVQAVVRSCTVPMT